MKFKTIILFTLLITLGLASSVTFAGSSVWKISKGDKYFYLGGTIHLLSPQDYPLPKEFMRAYHDSDKLIFETDVAKSKTPEFQQTFLSVMMQSDGNTLHHDLNDQIYSQLEHFLAVRNIPTKNFATFHPWAVALMITVMEYQRLGMLPEYGVEEYFHKASLSDNKDIGMLETLDEQLAFMKSMALIDPNTMVEHTLSDLNTMPDFIKLLKGSWRSGDIETFTTHTSIVKMKSEFPQLYRTIVTGRNDKWMLDLTELNNNNRKEFVLVGTLHLNGKEGLLNQLGLAGFKVKQL